MTSKAVLGPLYLPWAPLDEWLPTVVRPTRDGGLAGSTYRDTIAKATDVEIAETIGLHPARIYFFRKTGEITVNTADIVCSRMGVHISYVYGQLYWDYLEQRIAFDEARAEKKNRQRRDANARMVTARSQRRAEVRASCA